jgi:hypothetical protein
MNKVMIFIIAFIMFLASTVYAVEINFLCRNECISKGYFMGYCNSMCAHEDESGKKTKDFDCISSCVKKGYTIFNCYQSCSTTNSK